MRRTCPRCGTPSRRHAQGNEDIPTCGPVALHMRRDVTHLRLGQPRGLIVAAALAWLRQPRVALCLLDGVAAGVGLAAVLGVAVPSLLRLLRRDPRVAAGPIALAVSDVLTLLL